MTALLRDGSRSYRRIVFELLPLAAGVKAIKNGAAMLITSGTSAGYYAPASSGKTGIVKAVFAETVDNAAGADGALSANVEYGEELFCELLGNDVGGTPVVATDRGKVCYALDDATVTMAVTTCPAGIVHGIADDGLVEVVLFRKPIAPRFQSGTSTLIAGTRSVAAVLTATSRIFVEMKDFGAGAITGLAALCAPVASRNAGAGTFVVTAIDDTKATLATAVPTFDWFVVG